ncbi:MAG: hypothetical protein ACREC5_05515 [Thermoplasmata archaeon]
MAPGLEFDRIARIHEAARSWLSEEEWTALVDIAVDQRTALDAGFGSRFAVPLVSLSFELTGVDLSSTRMRRARPNGVATG